MAAAAAALPVTSEAATAQRFHFALVADPHIIDEFYKGPEGNAEDTDSIFKTSDRLIFARDQINQIRSVEKVFVAGDVFHNYPSADYDFYFKNKTRIDNAKEILDGFKAPVHLGFGNHDYDPKGKVSRAMSEKLFWEKLKTKPYYAVDHKGFRFLHVNNFQGRTWDPTLESNQREFGRIGEEQLNWIEAQLAERKPTLVIVHYPLWQVAPTEVKDYGLHPVLRKYKDNIPLVLSGHWHKWVDFGHTYGPRHIVSAATRYDQNAWMVMEADAKQGTIKWLDEDRAEWSTHFTKPYQKKA
jgi:hypothetical protein